MGDLLGRVFVMIEYYLSSKKLCLKIQYAHSVKQLLGFIQVGFAT